MKLEQLRKKAASLPGKPGVYIMLGAGGREIYVGKAARLRDRVRSYFQDQSRLDEKTRALVSSVRDVKYVETASEVEALILEARMIKDLQPRYNVRLRSDESYPLVEIPWRDEFPRPRVTRERGKRGAKYYGPFVDAKGLRRAMAVLRRAFRFRSCTRKIGAEDPKLARRRRARFVRPCLDCFIGLCSAPCAARITRKDYRAGLRRFEMFLRGRKENLLGELREGMKRAAVALEFEEAARLRDEISSIESLDRRGSLADGIEPVPPAIDPREAAEELGPALGLDGSARTIEGIDLANLGGSDAVGSVVTFMGGLPAKGGYRRFRIRGEATRDDYAMLREVVRRRYSRLKREKSPVPDVILIDGGLGHLRAAAGALDEIGLEGPLLAAISKSPDTPGRAKRGRARAAARKGARVPDKVRTLAKTRGVKFKRGCSAFRLLQFVRDEAHRFAQHYHHIRRRKRLLDGET